jgi:SAM-dependent methyltransferase
MQKIDFDEYADTYDDILKAQLNFFSKDDKYFARYKAGFVRKYLKAQPERILEYGCGTGRNLAFLKEAFPLAEIYGSDISAKSIAIAKEQNQFARCYCFEEDVMQYSDYFELIFVAGVFHHVAPSERAGVLRHINGLLSKTGSVFIFDHNPYNPVTRKLVRECPFDTDAILLSACGMCELLEKAGFVAILKKYTLFVPPSLARLARLERYLGWLPLGGQYCIQARKI